MYTCERTLYRLVLASKFLVTRREANLAKRVTSARARARANSRVANTHIRIRVYMLNISLPFRFTPLLFGLRLQSTIVLALSILKEDTRLERT